jgi:hypothetical protein
MLSKNVCIYLLGRDYRDEEHPLIDMVEYERLDKHARCVFANRPKDNLH